MSLLDRAATVLVGVAAVGSAERCAAVSSVKRRETDNSCCATCLRSFSCWMAELDRLLGVTWRLLSGGEPARYKPHIKTCPWCFCMLGVTVLWLEEDRRRTRQVYDMKSRYCAGVCIHEYHAHKCMCTVGQC